MRGMCEIVARHHGRGIVQPGKAPALRGFSLIELMAMVIIMAVLAGAAVVSLSSTTGDRSVVAARQLQRDMTYARQRAVATGARSWIEFSTGSQTWTLRAEDPTNPGRAPGGVPCAILNDPAANDSFIQALNTGAYIGVTMTSVNVDAEDWIGFDWMGRPLKKTAQTTPLGADAVVTFSGGETVTVNKDTGNAVFAP